jgi:ketosteroid isomerase-like protein
MLARIVWILAAALALPSFALATPEEDVGKSIRDRLDAVRRNDIDTWARFVADDMMAPLEGVTRSKEAWIRWHRVWPREVTYSYGPLHDLKVRINGDTAIATFHSDQLTEIGGQTTSVHKWQIETHVRRNSRWLLLGIGDGLIPREPVTAKIDSSILDGYAGEYEWAPTLISRFSRNGDRLLETFGTSEPGEWLPESDTTFFVPGEAAGGDSSRLIFVKDAAGRVTHCIYREFGATDRVLKKIH